MPTETQSFQTLDNPMRLAFEVDLPDGTSPAFATTGDTNVKVDERYWNSYDGELYRVTNVEGETVDAILEFGCGPIPRVVSFDCEWFTPDGHALHHVSEQSP